jgi:hypothetical protein
MAVDIVYPSEPDVEVPISRKRVGPSLRAWLQPKEADPKKMITEIVSRWVFQKKR